MRFKNLQGNIDQIKGNSSKLETDNANLQHELTLTKEVDYRLLAKKLNVVNDKLKIGDIIKVEVEGRNSTLQAQVDELRFQLESMGDNQDHLKNTKTDLEKKVKDLTEKLEGDQKVGKDAINLAYELRTYLNNKKHSYKDITRIVPATWTNIKKDLENIFKLVRLKDGYLKKRQEQIRKYRVGMVNAQKNVHRLGEELISLKEEFDNNNPDAIKNSLRRLLVIAKNNLFNTPNPREEVADEIQLVKIQLVKNELKQRYWLEIKPTVVTVNSTTHTIDMLYLEKNLHRSFFESDNDLKQFSITIGEPFNIVKHQFDPIIVEWSGRMFNCLKVFDGYRFWIDEDSFPANTKNVFTEVVNVAKSNVIEDYERFFELYSGSIELQTESIYSSCLDLVQWKNYQNLLKRWENLNKVGGLNDKEKKIVNLIGKVEKDSELKDINKTISEIKSLLTTDDNSDVPNLKNLPSSFVQLLEEFFRSSTSLNKSQKTITNLEREIKHKEDREQIFEDDITRLRNKDQDTLGLLKSANEEKSQVEAKRLALVELTDKLQKEMEEKVGVIKETQAEIDGLQEKLKETEGDKKGLKEELEKLKVEMEKSKNSAESTSNQIYGRSWKGFYNYLTTVVFDIEKGKKDHNKLISSSIGKIHPDKYYYYNKNAWINIFTDNLFNYDYLYKFILQVSDEKTLKEYDDSKKATELLLTEIRYSQGGKSDADRDFNILLEEYRKYTALQTTIPRKTRDWRSFYDWLVKNVWAYEKKNPAGFTYVSQFLIDLDRRIKVLGLSNEDYRFDFFDYKEDVPLFKLVKRDLEHFTWRNFEEEVYEVFFRDWKQATPLATETQTTTVYKTSSSEVWNDFYWWIRNNIVSINEVKDAFVKLETKFREGETEKYAGSSVDVEFLSFLQALQNQTLHLREYEENKDLTDFLLLPVDDKDLTPILTRLTREGEYKTYFNNLLNRYRKTVKFVEYKRGWGDFYEWLQVNITENRQEGMLKLVMKKELEKDYPTLAMKKTTNVTVTFYTLFLESLRRNFVYGFGTSENLGFFKPYEDNKTAEELINHSNKGIYIDINKLLNKYRTETKTLKRQVLENVPAGMVKLRTWSSFFEWLKTEIAGQTNIKDELEKDYPALYKNNSLFPSFYTQLKNKESSDGSKTVSIFSPYKENVKFLDLVSQNQNIFDFYKNVSKDKEFEKEFEKMLAQWKKDTPLQTVAKDANKPRPLNDIELKVITRMSDLVHNLNDIELKGTAEDDKAFVLGLQDLEKNLLTKLKGSDELVKITDNFVNGITDWKLNWDKNSKKAKTVAGTKVAIEKIMEKSWKGFYDWLLEQKLDRKGEGSAINYDLKITNNDNISQKALTRFMTSLESTIDKGDEPKTTIEEKNFDVSQWIKIGTFVFVKKGDSENSVIIEPKEIDLSGWATSKGIPNLFEAQQITYINSIPELDSGKTNKFELWFNNTKERVSEYNDFTYIKTLKKLILSSFNCDVKVLSEKTDFHIFSEFNTAWHFSDYFPFMRGVFWGAVDNKTRIGINSYNVVEKWFDDWKTWIPASSEQEKAVIENITNILGGLDRVSYADFNPEIQEEGYIGDADQKYVVRELKQKISDLKDKTSANNFPNLGILTTAFPIIADSVLNQRERIWKKEKDNNDQIKHLKEQIDNFHNSHQENSDILKHLNIYRTSSVLDLSEDKVEYGDPISGLVSYGIIKRKDIVSLLKQHSILELKYLKLNLKTLDEYNNISFNLAEIPNFSTKILDLAKGRVSWLKKITWPTGMDRGIANHNVINNAKLISSQIGFPYFPQFVGESQLYYDKNKAKFSTRSWSDNATIINMKIVNINLLIDDDKLPIPSPYIPDSFPTIEEVE